ncbi:hypothetical protein MTP99_018766 [Tenebrio molitor]|nr:hypothetical protein MTP99_018766 [Tenebrio molitor]
MSSGARDLCNLGSLTPGESARPPITGISPYTYTVRKVLMNERYLLWKKGKRTTVAAHEQQHKYHVNNTQLKPTTLCEDALNAEWPAQAQKRLEKRKRSDEGANGTRGDSPSSPTKSILNRRETRSNLCF